MSRGKFSPTNCRFFFFTRILMKDALIPRRNFRSRPGVPALEATQCDLFLLSMIVSTGVGGDDLIFNFSRF